MPKLLNRNSRESTESISYFLPHKTFLCKVAVKDMVVSLICDKSVFWKMLRFKDYLINSPNIKKQQMKISDPWMCAA